MTAAEGHWSLLQKVVAKKHTFKARYCESMKLEAELEIPILFLGIFRSQHCLFQIIQ